MLWSVSGWHSYPISVSRILLVSNPSRLSLKLLPLCPTPHSPSLPHSNGSTGQPPAFASDPALASSTTSPFRQRSTSTDLSFTYDQRLQRGVGFTGPEYSCRIIWSSSAVSSPPTGLTIPFFWSLYLVLVPISLSDRDCPSVCAVICEKECYRGEAPKNMESCP
jgi:hypothetical protein